jgi:hypothetical protein
MIVNRKSPNDHRLEGVTFHPGNQFVDDNIYRTKLEKNKDFKDQIKSGLMSIVEPPKDISPDLLKPGEDGKLPDVLKSLAETVAGLDEEKAIKVISEIIDGVDLKEIIKLDKRRNVVAAAEKQIEERQNTMNGKAPKLPKSNPGGLEFGGSEGAFKE